MSPREPRSRWEPSDGTQVDRQGVPPALADYRHVREDERRFFAHLCGQADREGVVRGQGQGKLAGRFKVDERTVRRWISTLVRRRMLLVRRTQQEAEYVVRPPACWISERIAYGHDDHTPTPAELAAHFGPAHRPAEAIRDRARNTGQQEPVTYDDALSEPDADVRSGPGSYRS